MAELNLLKKSRCILGSVHRSVVSADRKKSGKVTRYAAKGPRGRFVWRQWEAGDRRTWRRRKRDAGSSRVHLRSCLPVSSRRRRLRLRRRHWWLRSTASTRRRRSPNRDGATDDRRATVRGPPRLLNDTKKREPKTLKRSKQTRATPRREPCESRQICSGHSLRYSNSFIENAYKKHLTLKMLVKVTVYNISNGPIRWQISISIKVTFGHFSLALAVFDIFTFQNSWPLKCRSRSWRTTIEVASFHGKSPILWQ